MSNNSQFQNLSQTKGQLKKSKFHLALKPWQWVSILVVVGIVIAGAVVLWWSSPRPTPLRPYHPEQRAKRQITKIVNAAREDYEGLENFKVTVESYKGKPNQDVKDMTLKNKFDFYFQYPEGKSYTKPFEQNEQSRILFTNEPLRILAEIQAKRYKLSLIGEEKLGKTDTYVIEARLGELKQKLWIDKKKLVLLKADLFGTMLSRYYYDKVGGYWLPKKTVTTSGGETTVNLRSNYEVNIEIPERIKQKLK